MEIEIEITNKEQQLAQLHLDCVSKAEELSSLNSSYNKILDDIAKFEQDKKDFALNVAEEWSKINKEYDSINAERKSFIEMKESSAIELSNVKNDVKSSMKDLAKVNDMVLKARDEFATLKEDCELLNKRIEEQKTLVSAVDSLRESVTVLEAKRDVLKSQIQEMLEQSMQELTIARSELETIAKDLEIKTTERNKAEYELKKFLDELENRKKDFNIMLNRLEFTFNEKYPELKLNI